MSKSRTRPPHLVAALGAFTLCLAAGTVRAEPRRIIEVTNPEFRAFPVAVPNARSAGAAMAAPEIIAQLRWDLDTSILFRMLDPKSYLADPKREGMTATTIRFEDWLNVGAEGLVKVAVESGPEKTQAVFRFFDVTSGRKLLERTYDAPNEEARELAHRFADELILYLTGRPGIFQTDITAVRKTRSGREVWVVSMDGRRARPITKNGSINMLPAWFPDGKQILFTSIRDHNPNMYRVPAAGGRDAVLSRRQGLNTGGAVSPDGQQVALTLTKDGNSEIYVMNVDGSNLVRLTNEWAIDSSPTWSPDGKRIAFVSSRHGDPHIFVMDASGANVRRITDRGNYNQTPDWSPRGDLIAFTARDERNVFDLFTVDPETKVIRRLTQDQGHNEEPSFSPDGNHIAFTSTREGRSQLWIMGVDGSNQRRLTKDGGFLTPDWSPYLASTPQQ